MVQDRSKIMRHSRNAFLIIVGFIALLAGNAIADPAVQAGQLVGSWVRTSAANMDGLEFTKDGKVLVYIGDGNDATTADYSVMDDGRLNISMGEQAEFFVPSLVDGQLSLKDPATGTTSTFRQLKSGETIAAAIAGAKQADQQVAQNRNAAVPTFLNQQNLVLVFEAGDAKAPQPSALQFAANGNGYAGRAVFDGTPLHVDQLSAQLQGEADSQSLMISFLSGPEQTSLGQVTFRPTGTAPNVTLSAQVNFGDTFNTGANTTAVIKPDAVVFKQIMDHVKAEAGRLNDLRSPVIALLKDYAVLTGTSKSPLPSEKAGFADRFTLSRNPQNPQTWIGQGQSVNNATNATDIFPILAQVGVMSAKAAVQIQSPKRIYLFTDIDATAGKLSGTWHAPNNPNGNPAEATITQALDTKARDQLFATSKSTLMQIDAKTVFHAVIADQANTQSSPPNVISATLAIDASGAVTGKVVYPLEGFTMTLTGKEADTPMGPQLALKYSNGQPNTGALQDAPAFITQLASEEWLVSPVPDPAGHLRLTGYAIVNPANHGIPPVTLQLIPYTDADKAAIAQALNGDTKFKVTNPQGPGPDDILEFTTDPATSKTKLTLVAGGTHLNTALGITGTGDITDESGFAKLVAPMKRPVEGKANYAYGIYITPTDQGLYLNGYVYSTHIGANHLLGRWDALQVKP
jgi:hypothetical protein